MAALRARAVGRDAGHVIGVGAHAVADDLGEDVCAAGLGELELFEDEDAGAFADDEAVAVLVEGAAGAGGLVVARGEGAHGGESADRERVTEASAPPAIMASASPWRIMRTESPMELAEVAQAVAVAEMGPWAP